MAKSSPVKIGIISASEMARQHMEGVRANHNAVLHAVCDIDRDRLERAALDFNIPHIYQDYKDLIQDPSIDAVIVCTPDHLHCEMTVAALNAGKHVLCEKPMALRMDECLDMLGAEQNSSAGLMVGQICRYTPGFLRAKELIDRGEIGELYFVESEYAHDYLHVRGWNSWRADPALQREPYLGGGCHAVDLLRWIAGDPEEVTAYSNHKCLTDWPVNDCTISIFRFPRNVLGKVFVSIGCKRSYTMRSVFYGTEGTIITDNISPYLTLYKTQSPIVSDVDAQLVPHRLPVSINNHNTVGEIQGFVDAIQSGASMPTTGLDGARTVAVCLAAIESAKQGKPVVISYP